MLPHKGIAAIAVAGMAATALIEASLVYLLEPLMDEALVARNLDTARWLPIAFIAIFIARGIAGYATEASLGWIGRNVISSLRREVFNKFLTLPARFFDERTAGPLLSRMTYNVEMVAESVTSVVTIGIRDVLTVLAAFGDTRSLTGAATQIVKLRATHDTATSSSATGRAWASASGSRSAANSWSGRPDGSGSRATQARARR